MALFRIEFKNITRGEGRSAVAAAAYRAGEKIENKWDGVEHDYTSKEGVTYTEVLLPDSAPKEYSNRSELWNAVEMAEPSSKCRLARECLLALPVEFSREQQAELVRDFVQKNFVDIGMCADIAIHDPIYRDDLRRPIDADGNPIDDPEKFLHNNPHAHILLTVRPIGKNGKWEAKTKKEYLCRRGDEEKGFTGEEFKQAQLNGWEKQFRFTGHDGKKVWLTQSEAKEKGLDNSDRINRSPRSTPHGRENPTTAYWNDRKRVKEWRKSWEDILNKKFMELGMDIRVDSRSYADQGIDRMPGEHLGPYINKQEKRASRIEREGGAAEHTYRGTYNHTISDYNQAAKQHRETAQIADRKISQSAREMEHLRARVAANSYGGEVLTKGLHAAIEAAKQEEADAKTLLSTLDALESLNEKSMQTITTLANKLVNLGAAHLKQRQELQEQIEAERCKMTQRSEYVQQTLRQHGFASAEDVHEAADRQAMNLQDFTNRETQAEHLSQSENDGLRKYKELENAVPTLYKKKMINERIEARVAEETAAQKKLQGRLGAEFSTTVYRKHLIGIDKKMYGEKQSARKDGKKKTKQK